MNSSSRTSSLPTSVDLQGLAIDERANRVKVTVADDVVDAQKYFDQAYGSGLVSVEQGTVTLTGTQADNGPPWRGGQTFTTDRDGGTYRCTSGFIAHDASHYYAVTAGHCGPLGSVYWQADVDYVGASTRVDLRQIDGSRIPIDSADRTNDVTLEPGSYRQITSSQGTNDVVGQTTCITGGNFAGLRCGELLNKSYDVDTETDWGAQLVYAWGREADVDCNPGDSGWPALYGNQARGIISVKLTRNPGNDTCVYVHIKDELDQLQLTGVVTS